jgi:chemotaxis family two-component system sensor histidine kinase/response regulator PixL
MNTDPEIYAEGLSNFINETQELLQRIEQDLWQLHEEKSNATVHSLMRSTHTLKGASASVDLENIREIAHALEDIFKSLYNPDITIDAELEKYLFQAYETLQSLITEELVKHQQGGESEENAPVSPTMQTARDIIEKIKNYLGDAYNPDAEIPSSEELGFDMVQSIFEIGVKQRLESLQAALKSADSEEVASTLRSIAEVFVGLSESLKLPGFGDIAKTVLTAVEFNPDLAIKIAEVALEDFWEAVQAVLNGDRTRGGEPSQKLKNLAKSPDSSSNQASRQSVSSLPESASTDSATTGDINGSSVQAFTEDTETEQAEPALETTSNSQDGTADTTTEAGETDFGEFPSQETEEAFSAGGEIDDVFGSFDPNTIETADYSEPEQTADFAEDQGDIGESPGNHADFGGLEVEEMVEVPSPESSAEPSGETEETSAAEDTESDTSTTTSSQLTRKTDRELEKDSVPLSQWEEVSPSSESASATASSSPAAGKGSQHRETTTVRVDLDQLERLNFQAGELLIEHNKQYSGTEDLQASVKKLQEQLSQHQKILSSLQSLAWSINAKQTHDGVSNSLSASRSWGVSRKSRSGKPSLRKQAKSSQQANPDSTEFSGQTSNSSIESLKSSFPASKIGNLDSLEMDNYSQMQMLLQSAYEEMVQMQEVADSIDLYSKRSSSALHKQQRLLTKVRDDLTLARMQPIGEVLERFPRTVQQLCMTHDKDVALQIRGEDVLVDKAIAQKLYDPLLHLVRNAFSHGIESADQRQAKGKPAQGNIEIRAYTQGNRTTIEIRDDGKGIDYEAIRQRAIAQGLISSNRASTLRHHQLLEFIFETGFSTAKNVDNVSGRGVGLDVVRSQLNGMGAGITVTSHPDKGSCFRLQLPLTLSIAKLLVCESYGVYYAIPSETIEQILFPEAKEITYVGKQRVLSITREGTEHSVPIHRLEDLIRHTSSIPTKHSTPTNGHHATNETGLDAAALKSPKSLTTTGDNEDASLVLLLNSAAGLVGLEVESVLGEQELVIRPLSKVVRAPKYVYGCSILANSHLALVIDVLDLIQNRITQGNTAAAAAPSMSLATSRASNAYSTQAIASATSSALSTSSHQQGQASNASVEPHHNGTRNGSYGSGKEALPSVPNRRVSSIMVVDDSITLRQNVVTTLQKAGYRAVTARDGQEALDKLRGGESVDVILCDIEMPRINGFEFLSQYRQDEDISDIPTIMLTSRQGDKHRNIATGLGAVGYITKPYLERDLLAEIEQHLPSYSSSS